jgi:hypothetical protein
MCPAKLQERMIGPGELQELKARRHAQQTPCQDVPRRARARSQRRIGESGTGQFERSL